MARVTPKIITIFVCMLATITISGVASAAGSAELKPTNTSTNVSSVETSKTTENTSSQVKSSDDVLISSEKSENIQNEAIAKSDAAAGNNITTVSTDKTSSENKMTESALASTLSQKQTDNDTQIAKPAGSPHNLALANLIKSTRNEQIIFVHSRVATPITLLGAGPVSVSAPGARSNAPAPAREDLGDHLRGLFAAGSAVVLPQVTSQLLTSIGLGVLPKSIDYLPILVLVILTVVCLLAALTLLRKRNRLRGSPMTDKWIDFVSSFVVATKFVKGSVSGKCTPLFIEEVIL